MTLNFGFLGCIQIAGDSRTTKGSVQQLVDEILQTLDDIRAAFERLDTEKWIRNFHTPCTVITATRFVTLTSSAGAAQLIERRADHLRSMGLTASILEGTEVRIRSARSALVETTFRHLDAEGQTIDLLPCSYVFYKPEDRWLVALLEVSTGPLPPTPNTES